MNIKFKHRINWLYVLAMSRTRFQSEFTLNRCLNVKELLVWSRREIWRWSDCTWTRTQNHLVLKRTLNHFAKWLSVRLTTRWFWVRVQLQSVLYNACLAITDAIQGTNRDSIYAELGIESLSAGRWYLKLVLFYKTVHGLSPAYLIAYINFVSETNHNTRSSSLRHLEELFCRIKVFQS